MAYTFLQLAMEFKMLSVLIAFFVTLSLIPCLRPLAHKLQLIDIPGGRKQHSLITPLHGGICIFLGFSSACLLNTALFQYAWPMLLLSFFVLLLGAVDDIKELSARFRLLGQIILVSILIISTDTQITTLGGLDDTNKLELGVMSLPFTVFCFLAGINAINMSDGIDGLAGLLISATLWVIAAFAYSAGQMDTLLFCLSLSAAIFAFLCLNIPLPLRTRAHVFLGDAGSTVLGFMLVWVLIKCSQGEQALFSPAMGAWLFLVPLIDSGSTIIRRLLLKKSPMAPGRDHHHHLLQNTGLCAKKTSYLLFSIHLLTAVMVYLSQELLNEQLLIAVFFTLLLLDIYCLHSSASQKPSLTKLLQQWARKLRRFETE